MKVLRKAWDKKSLLEYLDLTEIYEKNPTAKVICQNEGCLFEVSMRECKISYELHETAEGLEEPVPYFTTECPVCLSEIVLIEPDFDNT